MKVKSTFCVLFLCVVFAGISTYRINIERLGCITTSVTTPTCRKLITFLEKLTTKSLAHFDLKGTHNVFSCMKSLMRWNNGVAVRVNATEMLVAALNFINYTGPCVGLNTRKVSQRISGLETDKNSDFEDEDDEDDDESGPNNYDLRMPGKDGLFGTRILVICLLVVAIILFQTYAVAKESARNARQDLHDGRYHPGDFTINLGVPDMVFDNTEGIDPDDSEEEIELLVRESSGRCNWKAHNDSAEPLL